MADGEQSEGDETGAQRRRRPRLLKLAVVFVVVAVAALLLHVYVVAPYYIPTASMEPTLHGCQGCNDDHVLAFKLDYDLHSVRRGDIVVFNRPPRWTVHEDTLIKRVIAIGGDLLTLRSGRLYVNGHQLDETYLNNECPRMSSLSLTHPEITQVGPVPKGAVFVMGDNRCNSDDSRHYGPFSTDLIIGRAIMIIYPFRRIGGL